MRRTCCVRFYSGLSESQLRSRRRAVGSGSLDGRNSFSNVFLRSVHLVPASSDSSADVARDVFELRSGESRDSVAAVLPFSRVPSDVPEVAVADAMDVSYARLVGWWDENLGHASVPFAVRRLLRSTASCTVFHPTPVASAGTAVAIVEPQIIVAGTAAAAVASAHERTASRLLLNRPEEAEVELLAAYRAIFWGVAQQLQRAREGRGDEENNNNKDLLCLGAVRTLRLAPLLLPLAMRAMSAGASMEDVGVLGDRLPKLTQTAMLKGFQRLWTEDRERLLFAKRTDADANAAAAASPAVTSAAERQRRAQSIGDTLGANELETTPQLRVELVIPPQLMPAFGAAFASEPWDAPTSLLMPSNGRMFDMYAGLAPPESLRAFDGFIGNRAEVVAAIDSGTAVPAATQTLAGDAVVAEEQMTHVQMIAATTAGRRSERVERQRERIDAFAKGLLPSPDEPAYVPLSSGLASDNTSAVVR